MTRRMLVAVLVGAALTLFGLAGTSCARAVSTRTPTTTSRAYAASTGTLPTSTATSSTVPAARSSSPCGRVSPAPTYRHVIWILEENSSYSSIIGSAGTPYLASLAQRCGVASDYHNITHLSLPNYLGLTDGAPLAALSPYLDDCSPSPSCEVTTTNLYEQAASAGGWKGYAESMPSNCDRAYAGNYAPRHNPAVYYTDLTSCSSDDLALGTATDSPLIRDFSSQSTAPAFALVTPNICDDMHGATGCPNNLIKTGDSWLEQWIPLVTATPVYRSGDTAIFIVWDEGAGGTLGENCVTNTADPSCHVPLVVIAPSVPPGTVFSAFLDHYSLLKTTEDLLGYPELGLARSAMSMAAGFDL
ncbi:MAG: alkaline phosphatase family protein [Acidimicrobiales bacterium]